MNTDNKVPLFYFLFGENNGSKLFKNQQQLIDSFEIEKSKKDGLRILLNQVLNGKKPISPNLKENIIKAVKKHPSFNEDLIKELEKSLLASKINKEFSADQLIRLGKIAEALGRPISLKEMEEFINKMSP